jgi:hypothetical protein
LQEAVAFNANDNLVDITGSEKKTIDFKDVLRFNSEAVPNSLVREVRLEAKENGVNPLCLAEGIVLIQKKEKVYKTPVLLTSLTIRQDKVKGEFLFDKEGSMFINPYLIRVLLTDFDLNTSDVNVENINSWLQQKGFELDTQLKKIGSFHHHRYAIVKELEDLLACDSFSEPLLELFGEFEDESTSWNLSNNELVPADTDHLKVFESLNKKSTVVQGPPGTGKTQVLVNIIGKALFANKKLTVVSEKHVALKVVQQKLREIGLDELSYIAASEHSNTTFIRSLEKTWKFFEGHELKAPIDLKLSEQHEQRLQLILDTINKPKLAGGVSYLDFRDRFEPVSKLEFDYHSSLPSLKEFIEEENLLHQIYDCGLNKSLGVLKPYALSEQNIGSLDEKIEHWIDEIKLLKNHFPIENWSHLDIAMKQAADIQIFENELVKQHSEILKPESKKRKKFDRLFKKWNAHPLKENPLAVSSHWKIRPNTLELEDLRERLSGGFWTRMKARKRWQQLSHLPVNKATDAIAEEVLTQQNEQSLSKILIDFCELGVENPSSTVSQLKNLTAYLTYEKWGIYEAIADDKKINLYTFHKQLRLLHDDLLNYFRMDAEDVLEEVFSKVKSDLGKLLSFPNLTHLSDKNLVLIKKCDSWNNYLADLLHSHKVQLEKTYPTLKDFDPSKIDQRLNELISLKKSESKELVQHILWKFGSKFSAYQQLLSTPARKLKEEEKHLKQKLKRGKSILVKEFGKSRRHLSLRELFSTEARLWIQLLKPVWLSNPAYLAKSLPLEKEIFDISVFDESTQIPLQNALGILQRSDRTLIAGDEHQMGPSNYFTASGSETEDLLNQAMYHLKSVPLQHHYRSNYPELIKFSNKHFYNDELLVYPSPEQPEKVIDLRFIQEGVFHDRRNLVEAEAIAEYMRAALKTDVQTGLVAFSEEQLKTILDQLNAEDLLTLNEKIEHDGWFCKALENLQGDECNHLIIGFGYGRNPEGEFHHRFGPINLLSGRNRLNVLMTRAQEKITLFSSVHSNDFRVTDNESVNLLKDLMLYFETNQQQRSLAFPHELEPETKENNLYFSSVLSRLTNVRELSTLHNVLTSRGWKVTYK